MNVFNDPSVSEPLPEEMLPSPYWVAMWETRERGRWCPDGEFSVTDPWHSPIIRESRGSSAVMVALIGNSVVALVMPVSRRPSTTSVSQALIKKILHLKAKKGMELWPRLIIGGSDCTSACIDEWVRFHFAKVLRPKRIRETCRMIHRQFLLHKIKGFLNYAVVCWNLTLGLLRKWFFLPPPSKLGEVEDCRAFLDGRSHQALTQVHGTWWLIPGLRFPLNINFKSSDVL